MRNIRGWLTVVALGASLLVDGGEAWLNDNPVWHGGFDWHQHDLMYKQLDSMFDAMFSDVYDLGVLPRSYISSFRQPGCQQRPETSRQQVEGVEGSSHRPSDKLQTDEELRHQAKLEQLREEQLKQTELREEHARLARQAEQQIRELEAAASPWKQEITQQQQEEAELHELERETGCAEQRRSEEIRQEEERQERVRQARLREEQEWIRQAKLREEQERVRQAKLQEERERVRQAKLREEQERVRQARLREEQERARKARLHETHRNERRAQDIHPSQKYGHPIVEHMASGYYPTDLSVQIRDGRIFITGNHVCSCSEDCISKEFSRSYALPTHIDPTTVAGVLDGQGKITLYGSRWRSRPRDELNALDIVVVGDGVPARPPVEEMKACLGKKGGIKLQRVSRKRGSDAEPELRTERDFEFAADRSSMGDDEFSTIEVEY